METAAKLATAVMAMLLALTGEAQQPQNFNATCIVQPCTARDIGGFYTQYGALVYGSLMPDIAGVARLAGGTGANNDMVMPMLAAFLDNGYRVRSMDIPSIADMVASNPDKIFAFDGQQATGNVWQFPLPAGQGLYPSPQLQSFWCGKDVYGFITDSSLRTDAPVVICTGQGPSLLSQTVNQLVAIDTRNEVYIRTAPVPSPSTGAPIGARAILRNADLTIAMGVNAGVCTGPQCVANPPRRDGMYPVIGFESDTWRRRIWPAQLIVNTSYFERCGFPGCGRTTGLLIDNGTERYARDNLDGTTPLDAILFSSSGKASIVTYESLPDALAAGTTLNAVGGNYVVQNGSIVPSRLLRVHEADRPESRTAIALTSDGWMWVVVVQGGDRKRALGYTASGLANYLISLGASDVIMVDGGGSSQLSCLVCDPPFESVAGDASGFRAVPVALAIVGGSNARQ